jgi:phospholipase C
MHMNVRRLSAAGLAAALASVTLSGCNNFSSALPSMQAPSSLRSQPQVVAAMHKDIKYVFVLVQENHSFDNYFGTYPGVENLGTALAKSHGYSQYDPIGKKNQTVFRITDPDILGPDQDRYILEKKMNGGKMNKFLSEEEESDVGYGSNAFDAHQYGLTTMAVYDCDTIPYLWMYARNFTLLDHYFQADTGPSTPGNVAVLAAQTGISEEHRFPALKVNPKTELGIPVTGDDDPFDGPYTSKGTHEIPLSFAAMPLLLGGAPAAKQAAEKGKEAEDIAQVAGSNAPAVPWRWFQEGFVNGEGVVARPGYIAHHNAPQYFDYLRKNDAYWSHEGTTKQALAAIEHGTLGSGGAFYIKGSADNDFGWKPANKNPVIQADYKGDDDHPGPGDSDHQVGEAFVATFVNAIARSKYWDQSAILVTWDDDGGFFDHVPPLRFEQCSDGYPCGDGPRLPFIVISPYANASSVMHEYADAASISKFIELVLDLPTMASLPDENIVAPYGPRDDNVALSDLSAAFDPARLTGSKPPIPASMAEIPATDVGKFPPPMNCKSLGITPLSIPAQPKDWNPFKVIKGNASRIERAFNQDTD